tara:strand:- start:348 stop:1184 length:837 start_codon:yes stop_codon:yes gene_type:complete
MLMPLIVIGQTSKELELCKAIQSQSKGFSSNSDAQEALDKIMSVTGLAKNFTLTPCDEIENAMAITLEGERYIFYDKKFLETISIKNSSNIAILAHEIGHHLNNHVIDLIVYAEGNVETSTKAESRRQELEADKFAGFIMSRLGYDLESAIGPFKSISNNEDDSYSTHPSRDKRISAVTAGFNSAGGQIKGGDKDTKVASNRSYRYTNIYDNNFSGRTLYVKSKFTLHSLPESTDSKTQVNKSEKIKIIEKIGLSWYKVETNGVEAYALSYDIVNSAL